jgi:hypothetical protein
MFPLFKKYVKDAYMKGFNKGLIVGIELERAKQNGKGLVLAACVQRDIAEIFERKGIR